MQTLQTQLVISVNGFNSCLSILLNYSNDVVLVMLVFSGKVATQLMCDGTVLTGLCIK